MFMKSYLTDVDKVLSGSKLSWSLCDVLDIGCWQAHAGDSNSAFTNQFLLKTMLLLLSRGTRDDFKDRPNDLFAFNVRRQAELAALVSQWWHE